MLPVVQAWMQERIPVFTTSDPAWCPCTVEKNWRGWDHPGPAPAWETNDKSCESVMQVIVSFNWVKTSTRDGYMDPRFRLGSTVYTTPPSHPGLQPFWVFPTTNGKGDVAFPLELRAPSSALFPGSLCCASGTPPVWLEVVSREVCAGGHYECLGPRTVYTTSWWTLPLGRPSKTLDATDGTTKTTSSNNGSIIKAQSSEIMTDTESQNTTTTLGRCRPFERSRSAEAAPSAHGVPPSAAMAS